MKGTPSRGANGIPRCRRGMTNWSGDVIGRKRIPYDIKPLHVYFSGQNNSTRPPGPSKDNTKDKMKAKNTPSASRSDLPGGKGSRSNNEIVAFLDGGAVNTL